MARDDRPGSAHVVVPLTLTDLAKALQEVIRLFRDAVGLANDGLTKFGATGRANALTILPI